MKNKKYILRPNHGSNAVYKSFNKNTAKKLVGAVMNNSLYKKAITINGVKYTLINWHHSRDGYDGISFYFITDTNKYIRISNHWCACSKYPKRKVQTVDWVGHSQWFLTGQDNSFHYTWETIRKQCFHLEAGSMPINKFRFYRNNGKIEK